MKARALYTSPRVSTDWRSTVTKLQMPVEIANARVASRAVGEWTPDERCIPNKSEMRPRCSLDGRDNSRRSSDCWSSELAGDMGGEGRGERGLDMAVSCDEVDEAGDPGMTKQQKQDRGKREGQCYGSLGHLQLTMRGCELRHRRAILELLWLRRGVQLRSWSMRGG